MAEPMGVLCYDVPVTQRSVYNKLRRQIKGYCLPMTWSVYLIHWSMKDDVERILKEIQEEKNMRIRYRILKFDDSDQKALDDACKDAFQHLIAQSKETLMSRLQKQEEKLAELEDKKDWEKNSLWSVAQARKKLDEARRLALLFNMSDVMEFGFMSLEKLLDAKRKEVEARFESENEVKITL